MKNSTSADKALKKLRSKCDWVVSHCMDVWGLTSVDYSSCGLWRRRGMIFSCVGVKSIDLQFITEITHSKYDFIVGSPPPRLSLFFT